MQLKQQDPNERIPPYLQEIYREMDSADERVIRIAQMLMNACFADRPGKCVAPNEYPAPTYYAQAVALSKDVMRRKLLIAAIEALDKE